jgi:Cu(I)/Ag(I) efflux system membrane fusion protein
MVTATSEAATPIRIAAKGICRFARSKAIYTSAIERTESRINNEKPADGDTRETRLRNLHPLLDEATRTLRVRLPLAGGRATRLGEYAQVTIHATPREVVSVPKSAVMRTGRGDFVMRALGKGHFMPVKVSTGIENAERVAIRDGLETGDQVAVNGQFLMDAAASIADTAQRMRAAQAPAP